MISASPSPKSKQRVRVFDSYRGRGHRNNNLWLVYSVKTGQDYIFSNDRRLVHWINFLEIDPNVASFEPPVKDDNILSPDLGVMHVRFRDGHEEVHIVHSEKKASNLGAILPQIHGLWTSNPTVHYFCDEQLKPVVCLAIRWLKAISYATAIRNQDHTHVSIALIPYLRNCKRGILNDIFSTLNDFDIPVICGLLIRLVSKGNLILDLRSKGLCQNTEWIWSGDENLVS